MEASLQRDTTMADRIMDHAQLLVQTVGYNGFSYADIALELGIRKATIHYYFRTKAELCAGVLQRYRARFRLLLADSVAGISSPKERLYLYLSFYQAALADGRLCPCGVLTGELPGLAPEVQAEVRGFFDEQIAWVEAQLSEARAHGELRVKQPARQLATSIFGMVEGGMLLARASGDPGMLAEAIAGSMSLVFS
ncbi:MAG: TetR/AcrR family transcriptional regulator [Acidobacteriota bacterium]